MPVVPGGDAERGQMVRRQLEARGIDDSRVLAAMEEVPRERFLPDHLQELAYEDSALPIEQGQTISQPYVVGMMTQAAQAQPGDRVLEIGTGSGYAAAVLSRVAQRVYTVERHGQLAALARERLRTLGYDNVEVQHGDGTDGWPEHAPYDAIVVTAAADEVPRPLWDQLAVGGRLVIPVGDGDDTQALRQMRRTGVETYSTHDLSPVRFVPLLPDVDDPHAAS